MKHALARPVSILGHPLLMLPLALLLPAASIVAAAILSSRWCKLSLHAAFAVFCGAMLLRWSAWAAAAVLAFAIAVLWSRLALARHLPRDLVAGAAAGAAAAVLSWPLAPDWPAP